MKFVVVGCGSIGKRHIRNLLALGHEVTAYNRGEARRMEVERIFAIPVYGRLREALENCRADAVVIATPQSLHVEQALEAARRGMHLFIEKPLSSSLAGLDELEREVKARDLVTHVGSNMRFHFGPASVRERLVAGQLGRPLWAAIWGGMYLPAWHPEEDYRMMYSARRDMGGGAVFDFIHELDLALWLFGRPEMVAGMTARSGWLDIETEDLVDVILRFANGLQVNVHLDYLQRPYQRGIRIVGDRGWIEWNMARQQVEGYDYQQGKIVSSPYPEDYDHNDMYREQMRYFISCLEEKRQSASDIQAGRRAVELALQVKQSSEKNTFITG